ncbi:uncharacterized protein K460DRAFT_405217 [Cucurbitaria berberidis CBS 394.84]|uniref:Uncharacterized protein n=1 Tax=Cucurbitaria berberidis CBS 394.84 TaxID=1168544 RepID=A0A9P4L849_9PLEO|nr:uncharacterized protein K460DRAFT_405217 [Cucurbitaria berberidis CBS 394.84]KAF1844939.1 hypothetical protein K460DRAFT_405217 [Cucurbitaria berberidis CBS 394.84]
MSHNILNRLAKSGVSGGSMLSASAPIMTALAQQNQAKSQPLPLSTVAKLLTRFLFGEIQLPPVLQQYGQLMLVFTGGAAIASSLYYFFQNHKENRAKVQLAVFHVIRMVENLPDLQAQLQDPRALIAQMDKEVTRMIGLHLSKTEAGSAMVELKRKVWAVADEKMKNEKRMKKDGETIQEAEATISGLFAPAEVRVQAPYQSEIPQIVIRSPSTENDIQMQLQEAVEDEEEVSDVSMLDIDDKKSVQKSPSPKHRSAYTSPAQAPLSTSSPARSLYTSPNQPPQSSQGRSTYRYPSSSESGEGPPSPTPAPRPRNTTPQTARTSYGFSYDDDELYSSVSASSSIKTSPAEQQPQQPQQPPIPRFIKKPRNILQAAILRAFDPNALGNRPYESPVLGKLKGMQSPRQIEVEAPPVSIATKTGGKLTGTPLTCIHESDSPQESPLPGTAEYRVSESRTFYKNVVDAREKRRLVKRLLRPEAVIEHGQIQSPAPVGFKEIASGQEWPVPVSTSSSQSEDDKSREHGHNSPIAPFDGPPTATPISPIIYAPPSDVELQEVPSPISDPAPSSTVIEAKTAGITVISTVQHSGPQTPTPAYTPPRVVASPSPTTLAKVSSKARTPSPPKRKQGRSRKVVGELQTPSQVQTPGTRQSARKSAYKGMYGK